MKNRYDSNGRVTGSSDALGRTMANEYDESGLLKAVTAPDGSRTEFTHDGRGNILTITDPYGVQTTYSYDDLNRITQTTDGNGNVIRYHYDNKDRIIMVINPEGNSRKYTYNASGKVERAEDFDGTFTTVSYNDLNRPEFLTDKEGRLTKRYYDKMWNISEEISPTGAVTRFAYDADNRLSEVSLCMAEGEEPVSVIRYSHDPVGNLIRTQTGNAALSDDDAEENVGADCATTTYEYDALNRVTKATNETGGITRYAYDETGKLQSVTDPAGNTVSYTYDNNGNVRTKENSDGYLLTYTYDCMNRVEKVTSSNGQEKSYTYDIMGNVTSMTDANGNTTAYEYTLGGKLSAVTDALGNRTQYRYDALDNLILIERMGEGEETGRKTEYIRNPLGQVEAVKDAFGKEERYTYDAFGRMREKTDRDGYTTAFTYEPDGKTKSILYADGKSVEMEYDALRRLICVRDWLGMTKIDRDAKGQIEAVTDHTGKTVTYRYGKMGERTGITYPDGKSVSYRYDEQLRLTEMQIPYGTDETEGKSITYHYDGKGRLSEKHFPDGMRTLWHYGENGELTELVHEDREGVLDRYGYEYDLMGNKTAITKERRGLEEESGRYEYGYDALSRLATVTKDGEALRSYAYDPFGNRSVMEDHRAGRKTAYAYDALDRLTGRRDTADGRESIREYLYDNRGNLTEEKEDGILLHGYAYNSLNRLERAWDAEGAEAVYEYNGLGQRTAKQTGEGREAYLLDLTKLYHNLLGMVRGDDERSFYWDGNAAAMAERKAGEGGHSILHYYLQDELGSPVRVSGYDSGYLAYGYDEFGNDLYRDLEEAGIPNPYSRQGEEQPFGYTGYRYDGISGTYFAQAREYQPKNGRFTAEDVIKGNGAVPETLNRYGYCLGNPVGLVDLDGRTPMDLSDEQESEYVAVIYLLNRGKLEIKEWVPDFGGAYGQGHAAILLVKNDGQGYFYSYAATPSIDAISLEGTEGFLATHLGDDGMIESIDVNKFLESGIVDTNSIISKNENGLKDSYTEGIYISITNSEGMAMYEAAERIRRDPGNYNLYSHNCNQVSQEILLAGGKNFSTTEFDLFDTRPNVVYDKRVHEIFKDKPEGWNYGSLENLLAGTLYDGDKWYNHLVSPFGLNNNTMFGNGCTFLE